MKKSVIALSTALLALAVLALGDGPAWAGTLLCKGGGQSQIDYPIPFNNLVKLTLYGSSQAGRIRCDTSVCQGTYRVQWTTQCGDSGTKEGPLGRGQEESLYMPVCSTGGQVTVRAMNGCIEVVNTTSSGY